MCGRNVSMNVSTFVKLNNSCADAPFTLINASLRISGAMPSINLGNTERNAIRCWGDGKPRSSSIVSCTVISGVTDSGDLQCWIIDMSVKLVG